MRNDESMDEKHAFYLVQQYFKGWEQNNLTTIKSCLSDDCVVIESHGPTYNGIHKIEKWLNLWIESKSKVLKWKINSFSFCIEKEIAFCEWDFSCVANDNKYDLTGISVVRFSDQKISFIHEYRMTFPPYTWEGNELKTE
jgi:ketosteroid isomerase-like protein